MAVSSRQMAVLDAGVLLKEHNGDDHSASGQVGDAKESCHSPSKPKSSTRSLMHRVFMPAKLT
jgi:hypothetical protein